MLNFCEKKLKFAKKMKKNSTDDVNKSADYFPNSHDHDYSKIEENETLCEKCNSQYIADL